MTELKSEPMVVNVLESVPPPHPQLEEYEMLIVQLAPAARLVEQVPPASLKVPIFELVLPILRLMLAAMVALVLVTVTDKVFVVYWVIYPKDRLAGLTLIVARGLTVRLISVEADKPVFGVAVNVPE